MEKSIAINIAAPPNHCKTMIASALTKILTDAGFKNITVPALETTREVFDGYHQRLSSLKDEPGIEGFLNTPVIITETHTGRHSIVTNHIAPTNEKLTSLLRAARTELCMGIGDRNEALLDEINKALGIE